MERQIIHALFSRIRVGAVKVVFWDGTSTTYGNGPSYFTLRISTPKVVRAMLRNLTMGFGEAYMRGDLEIDGDIRRVGELVSKNRAAFSHPALNRFNRHLSSNARRLQRKQIAHHYDLGNDFYRLWLDETMTYSCAYFRTPTDTLERAQEQKRRHILRKLQLRPGMTLLDIGSGWGHLLIAAAQEYGARGHGVTLSQEQYDLSSQKVAALGLSDQITIELINYQDLAERGDQFDRIVSVGMYEHVGRGNHRDYFKAINALLKPGGVTVLHTITNEFEMQNDSWIDRYVFPGGYIPSARETVGLMPEYDMRLQDYENLRRHYALTLDEWLVRYDAHKKVITARYGESFYRMWRLYLAGSITGFRWDTLSLSQFVMTKGLTEDFEMTRDHIYR